MKYNLLLKKLVVFYGLFLLIFTNASAQGVERWDIKTLKDSSYINVLFNDPIESTVKDLNLIPRPLNIKNFTPRLQEECYVFIVNCKVLDYIKQDDGDYHLIVCDLDNPEFKMIIEVIMPKYGNLLYYNKFKTVRDYITSKIRAKKLKGYNFKITGVAFFDFIHNQKGKAINCIELHPVLNIKSL